MLKVFHSDSFDPYYNLAVEQVLLESVAEGECILYLWRNENTVVIGKNQNAWKECRTELLRSEGGRLARRLSGGGAVFHDLGNLNFTFLMRQSSYDLDRQLRVIETAVRSFGIDARRSGRNDILADGRKFSGNAFYKNGTQAYHHGTLLVDADIDKLNRYLSPSRAKIQSKGVDSVRSRVVNLRQLAPAVTVDLLAAALERSFAEEYGGVPEGISLDSLDREKVCALRLRNESGDWLFGRKLSFDCRVEDRFSWGSLELCFCVERGVVVSAQVHSDSMDWTLAPQLEQVFRNCRFEKSALMACVKDLSVAEDVASLLTRLDI